MFNEAFIFNTFFLSSRNAYMSIVRFNTFFLAKIFTKKIQNKSKCPNVYLIFKISIKSALFQLNIQCLLITLCPNFHKTCFLIFSGLAENDRFFEKFQPG